MDVDCAVCVRVADYGVVVSSRHCAEVVVDGAVCSGDSGVHCARDHNRLRSNCGACHEACCQEDSKKKMHWRPDVCGLFATR